MSCGRSKGRRGARLKVGADALTFQRPRLSPCSPVTVPQEEGPGRTRPGEDHQGAEAALGWGVRARSAPHPAPPPRQGNPEGSGHRQRARGGQGCRGRWGGAGGRGSPPHGAHLGPRPRVPLSPLLAAPDRPARQVRGRALSRPLRSASPARILRQIRMRRRRRASPARAADALARPRDPLPPAPRAPRQPGLPLRGPGRGVCGTGALVGSHTATRTGLPQHPHRHPHHAQGPPRGSRRANMQTHRPTLRAAPVPPGCPGHSAHSVTRCP